MRISTKLLLLIGLSLALAACPPDGSEPGPLPPDIEISGPTSSTNSTVITYVSGSTSYDFGYTLTGYRELPISIKNIGTGPLTLSGSSPYIMFSGTYADQHTVPTPPSRTIPAGESSDCVIKVQGIYTHTSPQASTVVAKIESDDPDEAIFTFSITGSINS
jgi:hypothetical protein